MINYQKLYLSFQKINIYSRCGLQYYFRYIKGIQLPPTTAIAMGKAIHKSIETYYASKKESGKDPDLDLLLSTYSDELENAFSEELFLEEEEHTKGKSKIKDELKNIGIIGLKTYYKERAPQIVPFLIEEEFKLDLSEIAEKLGFDKTSYENIILTGYIDLVDTEGNIIDHKLRRNSSPSKDEAHKSQQLTIYSLGYNYLLGELPKSVKLDNIIVSNSKNVKLITLEATRNEDDIKRLLRRTIRIIDGIKKGVFIPPDHTSWACSYCLYKKTGDCKEYIT